MTFRRIQIKIIVLNFDVNHFRKFYMQKTIWQKLYKNLVSILKWIRFIFFFFEIEGLYCICILTCIFVFPFVLFLVFFYTFIKNNRWWYWVNVAFDLLIKRLFVYMVNGEDNAFGISNERISVRYFGCVCVVVWFVHGSIWNGWAHASTPTDIDIQSLRCCDINENSLLFEDLLLLNEFDLSLHQLTPRWSIHIAVVWDAGAWFLLLIDPSLVNKFDVNDDLFGLFSFSSSL